MRADFVHILCVGYLVRNFAFCYELITGEFPPQLALTNKCFIHRPAMDSDMGKDIDRDSYGFKF
jgi:hypothetical protein